MMTLTKIISTLLFFALFAACGEPQVDKKKSGPTIAGQKINNDSLLERLNSNIHFIGDSLLAGKAALIKQFVNTHQSDTCGVIAYQDSALREGFEGYHVLGDINGNKIPDTVLVLPPFNYCDDGDSYYFFDTSLPRLHTNSYCCHPYNIFPIGDIDEDGSTEICIFYSSCVSRFKSLIAYSLKDGVWKQVGRCTFDINIMKPDKTDRVKKLGKGKFQMLEIVDKPENKEWREFSF